MGLPLLGYTVPLLVLHALEARRDDLAVVFRWPALVRYSVFVLVGYLILLFGEVSGTQFIYFQF